MGNEARAFDAPLLHNFSRMSTDIENASDNVDFRGVAGKSLIESRPQSAVTVVTNHDTQPGQTSFTPMDSRLKTLFYAYILLRKEGLPCVFWGDVFGTDGPHGQPAACQSLDGTRPVLPDLVLARHLFAYGEQTDHDDDDGKNCIAWTRAGTHDLPGCVVLLSISPMGQQRVRTRRLAGRPGEVWFDVLAEVDDESAEVTIEDDGYGGFSCEGMWAAVYVKRRGEGTERFPVSTPAV